MRKRGRSNLVRQCFKNKTTLSTKEIALVCELILFLIKKKLFITNRVVLNNFGVLYFSQYFYTNKETKRPKKKVRLSRNRSFVSVLKGYKELKFESYSTSDNYEMIKVLARILNITKKKANFLFNVFTYGLCFQLLKENRVQFRNFGEFYIKECTYKKDIVCGRKVSIKRPFRILFKPANIFNKELKGKVKDMFVHEFLTTIFKVHKISTKVPETDRIIDLNKQYTGKKRLKVQLKKYKNT